MMLGSYSPILAAKMPKANEKRISARKRGKSKDVIFCHRSRQVIENTGAGSGTKPKRTLNEPRTKPAWAIAQDDGGVKPPLQEMGSRFRGNDEKNVRE